MELRQHASIFLVGPMASGKTTLGKLLAKRLGLQFLDTDHEIEKKNGVSVRVIPHARQPRRHHIHHPHLLLHLHSVDIKPHIPFPPVGQKKERVCVY